MSHLPPGTDETTGSQGVLADTNGASEEPCVCLTPDDIAALRFAHAVLTHLDQDGKDGDEYAYELLIEVHNAIPTTDAENGEYTDHLARLAALIGEQP
jgi:hypothetical protein